jgi:hypothetical protein
MKPFLVFAGSHYYPSGGFDDFEGDFDTLEEAKAKVGKQRDSEWAHIIRLPDGERWEFCEADTGYGLNQPAGWFNTDQRDKRDEEKGKARDAHYRTLDRTSALARAAREAKQEAVIADYRKRSEQATMSDQPPRLDATTVARAFEVMLPAHKASLSLQHNPHRGLTSVAEYLQAVATEEDVAFTGPVEQQKIEATDELWILVWYDSACDNSAAHKLAAASLPALAQWLQDNGLAFGS